MWDLAGRHASRTKSRCESRRVWNWRCRERRRTQVLWSCRWQDRCWGHREERCAWRMGGLKGQTYRSSGKNLGPAHRSSTGTARAVYKGGLGNDPENQVPRGWWICSSSGARYLKSAIPNLSPPLASCLLEQFVNNSSKLYPRSKVSHPLHCHPHPRTVPPMLTGLLHSLWPSPGQSWLQTPRLSLLASAGFRPSSPSSHPWNKPH